MATSKNNVKATETLPSESKTVNSETDKLVHLVVRPADYRIASFDIAGEEDVPLVIHRFSSKLKQQMRDKMVTGKAAGNRKNREPKDMDQVYEEARYRGREGWDGFHAAALRNAMISACRLVGFKMTIAKMSVFVLKDGVDMDEPRIPMIRIIGDPVKQEDMARVETGQPYVTVRAAYHNWRARVRIRWTLTNLPLTISPICWFALAVRSVSEKAGPIQKTAPAAAGGYFRSARCRQEHKR